MDIFLALEVLVHNLCDRALLCVSDVRGVDNTCIDNWFFVLWPRAGHFDLILQFNNKCDM